MQRVDNEIRRILDQQYALARKIIESNRDKMEAMAAALLEWETIDSDQIDDIMAGRTVRPPHKVESGEQPRVDAERAAHSAPAATDGGAEAAKPEAPASRPSDSPDRSESQNGGEGR